MGKEDLHEGLEQLSWGQMWRFFKEGHTPATLGLASALRFIRQKARILELGCAFGRASNYFSKEKDAFVVGIDINENEIEFAKEHSFDPGKKLTFLKMDATDLLLPDKEFDNVAIVGLLGAVELRARKKMLKEAHRVLRPDEKVMVIDFLKSDNPEKKEKYDEGYAKTGEKGTRVIEIEGHTIYVKHFEVEELRDLLLEAGFSVEDKDIIIETVEGPGVGDRIVEKRRQITVAGSRRATGH